MGAQEIRDSVNGIPAWIFGMLAGLYISKLATIGLCWIMYPSTMVKALEASGIEPVLGFAVIACWTLLSAIWGWAAMSQRKKHGGWRGEE